MKKIFVSIFAVFAVLALTACSNVEGKADKPVETTTTTALYSDSNSSSSVVTTVPVNTEVIVTGTTTNGYVPIVTTTGESGYVPSTSLTQSSTSKVTTTKVTTVSSGTTTKKPATVTSTTKVTTKVTTTSKKTTTTVKTTTKTTTTTKSTTTSASYVPFKKPVSFVYEGNDIYRATMNDGSIIVWTNVYGRLKIYDIPDVDNASTFKNITTAKYPQETAAKLTLLGKTKNNKYYYAKATWGAGEYIKEFTGYISVDTEAFIDVYFDYDAAYDIFLDINKERVKAGVEPLQYDYNLEKYAMFRSSELYILFEHYSPAETLSEHTQYRQKYVVPYHDMTNENIYQLRCDGLWTDYTLPTAAEINKEWVNSSGHYATMIGTGWKYVGVGVYRCEKGTFAIQVFGDGADILGDTD